MIDSVDCWFWASCPKRCTIEGMVAFFCFVKFDISESLWSRNESFKPNRSRNITLDDPCQWLPHLSFLWSICHIFPYCVSMRLEIFYWIFDTRKIDLEPTALFAFFNIYRRCEIQDMSNFHDDSLLSELTDRTPFWWNVMAYGDKGWRHMLPW